MLISLSPQRRPAPSNHHVTPDTRLGVHGGAIGFGSPSGLWASPQRAGPAGGGVGNFGLGVDFGSPLPPVGGPHMSPYAMSPFR